MRTDLLEVVLRELVRDAEQIPARMRIGEGADSQAIGRVELAL